LWLTHLLSKQATLQKIKSLMLEHIYRDTKTGKMIMIALLQSQQSRHILLVTPFSHIPATPLVYTEPCRIGHKGFYGYTSTVTGIQLIVGISIDVLQGRQEINY
jgi:hypothetical protein